MSTNDNIISSDSTCRENGCFDTITILPVKTDEGFQTVTLFGHSIRAKIEDGEPWFVIADLSKMFGIHSSTIPKRIENNPDDFKGWVCRRDVTSPRGNLPQSVIAVQFLFLTKSDQFWIPFDHLFSDSFS